MFKQWRLPIHMAPLLTHSFGHANALYALRICLCHGGNCPEPDSLQTPVLFTLPRSKTPNSASKLQGCCGTLMSLLGAILQTNRCCNIEDPNHESGRVSELESSNPCMRTENRRMLSSLLCAKLSLCMVFSSATNS